MASESASVRTSWMRSMRGGFRRITYFLTALFCFSIYLATKLSGQVPAAWRLPGRSTSPGPCLRLGNCSPLALDESHPFYDNPAAWIPDHSSPRHGRFVEPGAAETASALGSPTRGHLRAAVAVLRSEFFQRDAGTWPEAIDWTAAVAGTIMSAVFRTFAAEPGEDENGLDGIFSEILSFYFGQDAVMIRSEAYDDMLWVVLGWLESIEAVWEYSSSREASTLGGLKENWFGNLWVPAFAHRARIFWELAEAGWDTKMCNGGMFWNPRLIPYKNSITNQLWITASSSMFLHFPGDNNSSPFVPATPPERDRKHLIAAITGYEWLMGSGMMNAKGLFIDGYHIKDWNKGGRRCNIPSTIIFTYNQGVILSGQYNLWEATGDAKYLEEGHRLVQSVMRATGWNITAHEPIDRFKTDSLPVWHGLGRAGILEEQCDASGSCSQDAQTFKGIFFHHFTAFCSDHSSREIRRQLDQAEADAILDEHKVACEAYLPWVVHNVEAALSTRDDDGKAGMWWGAGLFAVDESPLTIESEEAPVLPGKVSGPALTKTRSGSAGGSVYKHQAVLGRGGSASRSTKGGDLNDRGRGRTVETQMGLVALLRAEYVLSSLAERRISSRSKTWLGRMVLTFWDF